MTEPEQTPDLEPGGGVPVGSTPPAEGATSELSTPQANVKPSGIFSGASVTLTAIAGLLILFGIGAVAVVVFAFIR